MGPRPAKRPGEGVHTERGRIAPWNLNVSPCSSPRQHCYLRLGISLPFTQLSPSHLQDTVAPPPGSPPYVLRGTPSHGSEQKSIMVQKSPGLRAKVSWASLPSLPLRSGWCRENPFTSLCLLSHLQTGNNSFCLTGLL